MADRYERAMAMAGLGPFIEEHQMGANTISRLAPVATAFETDRVKESIAKKPQPGDFVCRGPRQRKVHEFDGCFVTYENQFGLTTRCHIVTWRRWCKNAPVMLRLPAKRSN